MIDHDKLPEHKLAAVAIALVYGHHMDPWGLHGLAHWWRVRHNGLLMVDAMGASPRVLKLFALFPPCDRVSL